MTPRKKRLLVALLALAAILALAARLTIFRPPFFSPAQRTRPIADPILPATFPPGFRFGFANVGWQSEGILRADGSRVASNWSAWDAAGKIATGEHNLRGNGFLEGYEADLDRARSLGADAFSYALDWSRLEPAPGKFDDAELARVVAIVRAIRARGMRPLVVLFHWVTPAWVQSIETGVDLLASPTPTAFADAFLPVVDRVVPPLAGLVDEWVTFEEPWSIVGAEYLEGEHPPGHTLDITSAKRALEALMFLHARVYRRVHELDREDADGDGVACAVGFETLAVDCAPCEPGNAADEAAAKRADYVVNHHFLEGVWNGRIDRDLEGPGKGVAAPELARTLDFIGINYYQRIRVEAGGPFGWLPPIHGTPHYDVREYDLDAPHSDMWQEIAPDGLRRVIDELAPYGLPLVVSENGLGDARDEARPLYTLEHLYVIARAIADGRDVRGYYAWTIADNFEWDRGTEPRFGLFRVDFSKPGFPRERTRTADLFEAIARARAIDRATWDRFTMKSYPVGRRR